MANLHNLFLVLIFAVIILATHTSASKFCIRNDSQETKNEHQQCEILATTLTQKEKEILNRTMCKDHAKNIRGYYSYFRIRHGILEDRPSYQELCQEQSNPLLAWVPFEVVRNNIANNLNKSEINFYIAKATDKEKEKTELCYFRQVDMLNVTSRFVCTLMIFEDNFFGIKSDINVLVDILPILYEIRNVTYEPWTNVTHGYKTLLGKSVLKNPSSKQETVYGSIEYGFLEKIKLDTSIFENNILDKLPLAFDYHGQIVNIEKGVGNLENIKKSVFDRPMNPKSTIKVDLIGQWSEHRREFRANLYENFGNGIRHYKQPIELTKISFLKISNIEQVYENPEMVHPVKKSDASAKLTQGGMGENITTVNSTAGSHSKEWNHPYPGFLPYFVIACVIVGMGLLIPTFRIISTLRTERKGVKRPRRY